MHDLSQDIPPLITLRIPGRWPGPAAVDRALPAGYGITDSRLTLPDGGGVDACFQVADREFPGIFAMACRRDPSARDRRTIERYRLNVCLTGRGGSLEAVRRIVDGAAAVVRAGGAGVFVDNSALAHGSGTWLELADDRDDADALLYAFVNRVGSSGEIWSVGMHTIGFRDAVLVRTGDDLVDDPTLAGFLEYSLRPVHPVADGDYVGDGNGPTFQVYKEPCRRFRPGSPLHNPYGSWRLVPI